MTDDLKTQKETMRTEAKRARGLLSMNAQEHDDLISYFFDNITIDKDSIIAAYWPKGRELDTQMLIDVCLEKEASVALPVIEKGSRILKFAHYDHDTEMVNDEFDIYHPVINEKTVLLEPDIFIVPMLAYDRKGNRLGYGGGYYDATLSHYGQKKDIIAIGLAYAQQACLFNLPSEEHDVKMDWIITQQGAQSFT